MLINYSLLPYKTGGQFAKMVISSQLNYRKVSMAVLDLRVREELYWWLDDNLPDCTNHDVANGKELILCL